LLLNGADATITNNSKNTAIYEANIPELKDWMMLFISNNKIYDTIKVLRDKNKIKQVYNVYDNIEDS